jgi:class 3 adenylate cyclase
MRWISSIELIEKTNISRATLNNYIRMKILPKPDVRKPSEPLVRAKRLGYFPESVLSTLEQIKSLKGEGYAMATILKRLNKISSERQEPAKLNRKINSQVSMFEEILPEPVENKLKSVIYEDYGKSAPDFNSFCVLAADLQDAERVIAEFHPEEYFDLISQLWDSVLAAVSLNHGLCGSYPWQGIMFFYFPKMANNPYPMNAIHCAVQLREVMVKLTNDWKLRKACLNELYLNIGISEGEEYLGYIRTPSGMSPATFGETVRQAIRLAEFARGGSIWLTKRAIQKINRKERESIRYGVSRHSQDREIFVRNSFARISDIMLHDPSESHRFADIEGLAVTEITDPF